MNNQQIFMLLKRHVGTRHVLENVYALDTLPMNAINHRPIAYIVNTAPITRLGEHWVCLYLGKNVLPEYFDSYGLNPDPVFVNFMGGSYKKSNIMFQHPLATTCGQYCMAYLYMRSVCNMSICDIITHLESKAKTIDNYINSLVERIFQVDLDVQNSKFLLEQMSNI